MKKKITKYRWDNIFKDITGIILIAVAIIAIVGSCNRTEASTETPSVKSYFDVPLSYNLQDHIFSLCEEYGIAPEVIVAMIERESNYGASAVGDNGESVGLMQIQEHNHYDRIERLGVTDLFDPFENVEVGIDFLAQCITRNGGNLEMALMSYNAGQRGAETNYFSKGIYSNAYSQKVLEKAKILKEGMIEVYTDDPIADFHRHDAEQQAELDRLPKCSYCNEPIQEEKLFDIEGELYCEEHAFELFRKDTEDYIE
jgi:hypothetical protein